MIDLSLDDAQQEIVTAATDFLKEAAPLERLRGAASEIALHETLAQWGWFGAGVGEADGGFGLGPVEEALFYIEAGRLLLAPSVLATALAAASGPADLRADMQSGVQRAAMALSTANGSVYCFEREGAALLVMLCGAEVSFHRASDFAGEAVEGFDEALATEKGAMTAPALHVSADASRAALLIAALLAGCAAGAADLGIEYAKMREQFGQPIGAFQAIKHRCANMGVAAFAATSQVTMAAACLAEGAAQEQLELAAAIQLAVKLSRENAASAIQVHGGMGFTAECDAHRFLKRAHVLSRILGDRRSYEAALLAVG
jgi:alkylation response protein AidB-like acyl-CoA dehydrogenase